MNKKELTEEQYNKIADHVVYLYNEQSYFIDEDWYDIIDTLYKIDDNLSVYLLIKHIDNGHEVVLTKDENDNCEMGWRVTYHNCTILEISFFDKDMNKINDYNVDKRKLELLIENKLPITNE